MKTLELPMRPGKLAPALQDLGRFLPPQYDTQINELKVWCESLTTAGKQEEQ
jgi:hypothetical protein